MYRLPQGFLQKHNNTDLVERCDEKLLPKWPVCPGPLARMSRQLLVRPNVTDMLVRSSPILVDIYNKVVSYGVPNYGGARVPINPNCDVNKWSDYLRGYDDFQVIQFRTYGWPAGYESMEIPVVGLSNHLSSSLHPEEVSKYLQKEIEHNAIWGPFKSNPFNWFRTNPLMVRPKKEEGKYRVILDLSFPCCMSVNSFIPRLSFDGAPYKPQTAYCSGHGGNHF